MFYLTSLDEFGEILQVSAAASRRAAEGGRHPSAVFTVEEEPPNDGKQYYWDSGWVARPEKPEGEFIWNPATKVWEDPRSFEQLKEAKWEEMKERRLAALLAPLETPFGVFDADARGAMNIKDTISLQAALVGMGMPSEVSFTLADNTEVTLTQQQMLTVGILLGARTQEIYSKGRALRLRIDATTSPGELNEILW